MGKDLARGVVRVLRVMRVMRTLRSTLRRARAKVRVAAPRSVRVTRARAKIKGPAAT